MGRPKKQKKDLFGVVQETERGWTELDRIRRRFTILERKIDVGDFTSDEADEFAMLRVKIEFREREAKEKWAKSFNR